MGRKDKAASKHKRSLGVDILDPASQGVRTVPRAKKRARTDNESDDDDLGVGPVSQELSNAILREARAQRDEVQEEGKRGLSKDPTRETASGLLSGALKAALETLENEGDGESDGISEEEFDDTQTLMTVGEGVSEEDERVLNAFRNPGAGVQQRTLTDVILAKVQEKTEGLGVADRPMADDSLEPPGIGPEAIQVFRATGQLLSKYRCGRVPKSFRIIPSLRNWEEALFLTNPEGWTPQAHFLATKMFITSFNEKMAQRFLNLVLLPKVREYIREHKRCHFMLFEALKRSCFKAGAFFKGVLLPLCQAGDCSVREAVIMSSLMKKVSLHALHSAAALLRLADMDYNGFNSFFIRTILDKKYALPYKVIDGLVQHFMRFEDEERLLPVVWHHALLALVQRYKFDIKDDDKVQLKRLLKSQYHPLVTPEIRRELDQVQAPGKVPIARVTPGEGMQTD